MEAVQQGAAVTVQEFERDGTKQRMNWTHADGQPIPGGDALWEIPEDVRNFRGISYEDRFRATSWTPSCVLNYRDRKGWNLITIGLRGAHGDWQPLFRKAAAEYPDRAAEFNGQADLCIKNEAERVAEAAQKPPSAKEIADARDERLARVMAAEFAKAQAAAQEPAETKTSRSK